MDKLTLVALAENQPRRAVKYVNPHEESMSNECAECALRLNEGLDFEAEQEAFEWTSLVMRSDMKVSSKCNACKCELEFE